MPETSIVISAKDNFSQTLLTIRNSTSKFNKDLEGLSQKLGELDKTKHTIKLDLDKAKRELKETEKAFRSTDEAARDDTALREAEEKYDNLRRQLAAVGKEARQTEKDIMNMSDASNRASNRAFGTPSSVSSGEKGLLSGLSKAGIGAMAGNAVGQLVNVGISSAFGDATGTMISSTLSGAISGGAMGAMAGPVGMAIGGVVGGISGAASGAAKNFAKEDDAFKAYTNDQYQGIMGQRKSDLQTGSGIAAGRENDLRVFGVLLQGDNKEAAKLQNTLLEIGRTPPFSYGLAKSMSLDMLGLGETPDKAIGQINGIADAAAALGWTESDTETIVANLNAMATSGIVTAANLKTLAKKGVDAYQAVADAFDIAPEDVPSRLKDFDGAKVKDAIFASMENDPKFKGAAASLGKTFSGAKGILESYQEDLQAAMGEGYNDVRAKGMREQIKYFESPSGETMEKAYAAIGRHQGDLENLKEQYERDAYTYLMDPAVPMSKLYQTPENKDTAERLKAMRQEYREASKQDDGGTMDSLLAEAQSISENAYHADTNTQTEMKRQTDLLAQIKINTASLHEYWNGDFLMTREESKGALDLHHKAFEEKVVSPIWGTLGIKDEHRFVGEILQDTLTGSSHAYGLTYVPRDNYRAVLHEGERVLTAQEARGYGPGESVTVTGNQFTVREDADVGRIAREIVRQFELQRMASGLSAGGAHR